MIKIENTEVYGWEAAVRGMRNPMNSWDKSDTELTISTQYFGNVSTRQTEICIGKKDFALMKTLVEAGTDHRKFLRMVNVTVDITAPLYWWKEFDTYKVGTVRNSCSTMHTIAKKEFTLDDFSIEHIESIDFIDVDALGYTDCSSIDNWTLAKLIVEVLNFNRKKYLETKDKGYWWQMIQLLPSSYNQRATVQLNYEVLLNMYHSRKNHKLDEWRTFCEWIEKLPYMEEFI